MTPDATIPSTDGPRIMPLVVGATRSGTTLLRLMLDSHPQVAIPSETSFPAGLFEAALVESGESIANRVVAADKWADLRLDAEAYRARCRGRSGVEALRLVWQTYGDVHAKPIVGDKSPQYVRFLPSIARVIPELRVIHLVRDGRDCFASQRHSRFSLRSAEIRQPGMQAMKWCEAVRAGRAAGPSLSGTSGAYLELRYEMLVVEPERELRRICTFLGIEFDPRMLEYASRAESRLSELGDRTTSEGRPQSAAVRRMAFALTGTAPDPMRVGRWQEALLPDEVEAFESVAGPLLVECGYELSATILARSDKVAAQERAASSEAASKRSDYDDAKRDAVRAFRADPTSLERIGALRQLAGWTEDLPVYWCMETVRTMRLPDSFEGRLPPWRGQPLDAENRLFIASYGRHLGFNLRSSATLTMLGDLAPFCTLAVEPRLMPLIRRRLPSLEMVPLGSEPPAKARYQATWGTLGYYLLPSTAAMPDVPWLEPDPARVRSFERRDPTKPRVAFLWHSSNARKQLPPAEAWRPLLAAPGIEWVSVQHEIDARAVPEWEDLGSRIVVEDLDLRNDLDALAALLRSCDLLTGISASAMHLAGALHVPTWMLVREMPRLLWPLGRERSSWYPKMRLLWVAESADWERRIRDLADDLGRWASEFKPRSECR